MSAPIKSRPRYPGLAAVASARRNLVVVDAEGARAADRMLAGAPAGFAGRTEVVLVHGGPAGGAAGDAAGDGAGAVRALREHGVGVEVVPDAEAAIGEAGRRLATATMGTRLYAAGAEGLVGQVVRLGLEHGIDPRSVLTEHCGTLARRVQCVHCKVTTESVTTSPFTCTGCGHLLLVRDHYSSRLAAFQGVCVNAEDPTEQPEAEPAFAGTVG